MKVKNMFSFVIPRPFQFGLLGMFIVLLVTVSAPPVGAQGSSDLVLEFSMALSDTEVIPGAEVNLLIDVTNTGNVAVEDYAVQLYLTTDLTLAEDKAQHYLYEPLLNQTLSLAPGASENIVVPLYVFEKATTSQAIALVHPREDEDGSDRIVARLDMPVKGGSQPLSAQDYDKNMPETPTIACGETPALSTVGNYVNDTIGGNFPSFFKYPYFSKYTKCNKFEGDWILDVPNVTSTTPDTTAEDFYKAIGDLIRETEYTFSMSTLGFYTHKYKEGGEHPEYNLVQEYLSPAIRDLHKKFKGKDKKPLLRFAYSDSNPSLGLPDHDDIDEVYEDLIHDLKNEEKDPDKWNVSIAIVTIGQINPLSAIDIPFFPNIIPGSVMSPWNHSKIAVRDYRHAIVGGMNWDLNYIVATDVDGDMDNYDDETPRLYDLSVNVEGEAAKVSGIYFDKLWRRAIDPHFAHFVSTGDCKTSWKWGNIVVRYHNDCSLDAVPDYAPNNKIPDYSIDSQHNVFGLGRGHTEWYPRDDMDYSGDDAILGSFAKAEKTIYINQHQITNPQFKDWKLCPLCSVNDSFTPEVKDAILDAVINRQIHVKIIISDPWGDSKKYSHSEILKSLDDELHDRMTEPFWAFWRKEKFSDEERNDAHCRLEFAPFRRDTNTVDYTHNKFVMVDEKAFYVGSQNLYPSAIGETSLRPIPGTSGGLLPVPELNEYGFLIDDTSLAAVIKRDYWDPVWTASRTTEVAKEYKSKHLPDGWDCSALFPLAIINPNDTNPAYAGPHNNPQKIVIEVNKQVNGKVKDDFEVKIGGKVAEIVTFFEDNDRYKIEVIPPQQNANGLYDVTVTSGDNSATETDAVSYADTNSVDVMLVLDRSGSMEINDNISKAKEAAKLFVDYMYDNDQIGVASFSYCNYVDPYYCSVIQSWYARTDYSLGPIDTSSKIQAKNKIDALTPFGRTTIGGGLQEAQEQLLSNGQVTHPWAIVLLSDGEENEPPFVANVLPDIKNTKTVVHTIALGQEADQAQMLEIASQTGGTYNYVPTDIGLDVQLELADIYNAIAGTVTGQQNIFSLLGLLPSKFTTHKSNVTIDSTIGDATFSAYWLKDSNIKMTLVTPDGTIIDSISAASNPNVSYVAGDTRAFYRMKRPTLTTGVWKVILSREETSARTKLVATDEDEIPYSIEVNGRIDGVAVTMHSYLDKTNYITNTPIKVSITLSDDKPILGAEVTAIVGPLVTGMQASQDIPNNPILQLYDDGAHGDGQANDGVYANTLVARNTLKADSYTFQVFASGTANNGQQFSRRTQQSVNVGITSSTDPSSVSAMSELNTNTIYLPLVTK
jgi:phosphatidylserine/phosphatidylglycerophosphate/cardiolipin synthase-like enzyme